jgi:hypothetical protein
MKTEDNFEPDLKGFNKENPFRVPDGYFDRFPMKMSERINQEKTRFTFPFPSLLKPIPMFATAAVVITVGIFGLKTLTKSDETLSEEEISNYVYQEGIIDELTEEELIEYSNLAFTEEDTTTQTINTDDQTIQEYLLDQDLDEADIINEL